MHCSMGVKDGSPGGQKSILIPWPPKSPDLNVIEHLWAKLKEGRVVRYGNNPPRNPQQLRDQVVEIWGDLAQDSNIAVPWLTLCPEDTRRS